MSCVLTHTFEFQVRRSPTVYSLIGTPMEVVGYKTPTLASTVGRSTWSLGEFEGPHLIKNSRSIYMARSLFSHPIDDFVHKLQQSPRRARLCSRRVGSRSGDEYTDWDKAESILWPCLHSRKTPNLRAVRRRWTIPVRIEVVDLWWLPTCINLNFDVTHTSLGHMYRIKSATRRRILSCWAWLHVDRCRFGSAQGWSDLHDSRFKNKG
jgi:hypothetical protein